VTDLPTDLTPLVLHGDARTLMRTLAEASVQCVVTSYPYWGQRVYETEPQVWGGNADHDHQWVGTPPRRARSAKDAGATSTYGADPNANYEARGGASCSCGAWLGEFGLEPTPELYVEHGGLVVDEIMRVLKDDGTAWINLASTYATYPSGLTGSKRWAKSSCTPGGDKGAEMSGAFDKRAPGWKRKELVPIPWLFGLEVHRRGWWIRADVQWWKLNGKHENVKDRPFRSHEYVTMYTKTADPYYDEEAVRQPYVPSTLREVGVAYRSESRKTVVDGQEYSLYDRAGAEDPSDLKRRIIRSLAERGGSMLPDVWYMATGDGEGRHVAVFPETLPELCITASTRPGDVVLDPFAGSGTTLRVARRLRRRSIGIELNPESVKYALERTARPQTQDLRAFAEVTP
jgi:DNA modification methylase